MELDNLLLNTDGITELGLDLVSFANGMPGGFFIYEAHDDERILFANEQMARIFRCDNARDFIDYVGGSFSGVVYHEDLPRVEDSIWSQISATEADVQMSRDHVTYRIKAKDGTLHYMDEYGRLVHNTTRGDLFFVFVTDISAVTSSVTDDANRVNHVRLSADVDALTGLPSMRYYHMHVGELLARATANGTPMADVYFDVDHFKTVNYRLGYEGGDEVLQHIGAVLRETFPDDLCARFSDDHFVLVTRRKGLKERLDEVHERVLRLVAGMPIEIKAGVYLLAPNDVSIAFAHDRAKVACDSIKGRFDKVFKVYDETLAVNEEMRDYIVNHIEEASEKGWIHNFYQPVVSVQGKLTSSVEALSRWIDPERGTILPSQYVRVLEETRLIHHLDSAVVVRACKDLQRTVKRLGTAVPVSLNFSPSALALLDVPQLVEDQVDKYDLSHDLVHVEITESSLTDDPELLRSVIRRLHKRNFEVWMDDFGSGYSSLNLLKDYDFDVLKVDMEFLRGMEGNERSCTIVRSITNLAHKLNMTTLVEGVETASQFDFLREVGADRAQGFLFSAPVPYEAIVDDFFLRYPPAH